MTENSPADYQIASERCGVVTRADRRLLRFHGRSPRQVLDGILANRIPDPPTGYGGTMSTGASLKDIPPRAGKRSSAGREERRDTSTASHYESVYGTILTPKGKMITDQKVFWLGCTETDGLGLDVAAAGYAGVLAHFGRLLPPRLARMEELEKMVKLLTVVGPTADAVVARLWQVDDAEGSKPTIEATPARKSHKAGSLTLVDGGPLAGGAIVGAGLEQPPSWDVWVATTAEARIRRQLEAAGAEPIGTDAWNTLRVEEGYPAFGVDMDDRTIPIEAGLGERAIDHTKGCYTGQEVIVRILHRGRVNWHLRALRFGDAAVVTAGQQLFSADSEKPRGRVTSVVDSPRFGQKIGLGYVRREVKPPATLNLGEKSGPNVQIRAIHIPQKNKSPKETNEE